MMRKLNFKSEQTAQGMVEFALVLPILLLLILGVFAFGHMFFVYSSVVSASREAARWGSAVGEAPSAFPRYQDCASIRASAVRVGAFAGVNAGEFDPVVDTDSGINIAYDNGPGTAEFDECPVGESGPEQVVVGDRILVTVRVFYKPIVPFINIPSFPLEATTARTIIIGLPVGEAPVAEDPCTVSTDIDLYADLEPSYVGQPMNYIFTAYVPDDTTNIPTGQARLVDSDGYSWDIVDLVDGMASFPFTYTLAGVKQLTAEYIPDSVCYMPFAITPEDGVEHEVLQAPTQMTFTLTPPINMTVNQVLQVGVTVSAVTPGAGVPTGPVTVSIPGLAPCNATLTESGGNGVASCTFIPNTQGSTTITGIYAEDADPNFAATTRTQSINVLRASTPTPTGIPFTPTPVETPTRTPLPSYCPHASSIDFSLGSSLQFSLAHNGSGAANTDVTSVRLYWPNTSEARWQEVRMGADVSAWDTSGGDANGIWRNVSGLSAPSQLVNSSSTGWESGALRLSKNDTEIMRLVFNNVLPVGQYHIIVTFNDRNCQVDVEGYR